MTEQKQDVAKEEETLVEFPCDFFIKVMGETSDDFANTMVKLVAMLMLMTTQANFKTYQ